MDRDSDAGIPATISERIAALEAERDALRQASTLARLERDVKALRRGEEPATEPGRLTTAPQEHMVKKRTLRPKDLETYSGKTLKAHRVFIRESLM